MATKSKTFQLSFATIEPDGLKFKKKKPAFDVFEKGFHSLLERRSTDLWAIADAYNKGAEWFGEDVTQVIDPRRMSESRLQTISGVGRKFWGERRAYRYTPDRLSFSHHEAVRSLIGNTDHPEWEEEAWSILAKADAEGLSVSDVEALVAKAKGESIEQQFMKSSLEQLVDLRAELSTVISGLPPTWDEERALLDKSEKHLVDAINSARNRAVGDPAQMEMVA
jgi:hypothetical protein